MKKIFLFLTLTTLVTTLSAQYITFDMPKNAGLKMSVLLKNGIKADTIFSGSFDKKGRLVLPVPKNHQGIAVIVPDRMGAYFEFIVAGEDMTLHCNEEYPHSGNVIFENSSENDSLNAWFSGQTIRQQKIGLLTELERVYAAGATGRSPVTQTFITEKESLIKEQEAFEAMLPESPLYAARFMELHGVLNKKIGRLLYADSLQMAETRRYMTDTLDLQVLFTSGLWYNILNGSLALYDNDAPYHKEFITDMSKLLKRAPSDRIYTTLAENLFAICEATGWNDLEEELAYFLINDGRINEPTGKLKQLMTLFKLTKGSPAPPLTSHTSDDESTQDARMQHAPANTILVFYETGCGSCDTAMQELKQSYPQLQEIGYRVISISSDTDERIFRNTSDQFPWKEKYCDLQGFNGEDFKKYGVIGTPTIFVIDNEGIIQGRYARLRDTGVLK